jgi:hypothetical protein
MNYDKSLSKIINEFMMVNLIIGIGMGAITSSFIMRTYYDVKYNLIPKETNIEKNYILPNQIKISVQDLNQNDTLEVYLKYDNKKYMFKVDEQNKPYVQEFEMIKSK